MSIGETIVRLLGRYSEGLRLAREHGPRSGNLIEYAYENTPQGAGRLGRWIDRGFLQLGTWHGARERMRTTRALVLELVTRRRKAGARTVVLDVASGTARYLRELAREHGGDDLVIVCHDRDPRQVMLGRELVAAEGLPRFSFAVGDATDQASYLTSHDPDIILAVDLFPLLHQDAAVRAVMRLAFTHLTPGGSFLCTTLARRSPGPSYLDADAFRRPPATRSPHTIAAWLRDTGFVHIDQRFSQPGGFALVGTKPL